MKKGFEVCEMFETLQGEGRYSGKPALFIRLSGCNLKCSFCDEPKHKDSSLGKWYPKSATLLYDIIRNHGEFLQRTGAIIVISGGEPTIYGELPLLIKKLRTSFGTLVCVESNGYKPLNALGCDLYTFSPKEFVGESYNPWENIKELFFKFVNLDIKLLVGSSPNTIIRLNDNLRLCRDLVYTDKMYFNSVEVFLSPINLRNTIDESNVDKTINFILNDYDKRCGLPLRLNSQIHKIFKFQ